MLHEKKRFSEGLTGYHYLVLLVACMAWSFETFDQWLFVFSKQRAITELLGAAGSDPKMVGKWTNIATAALMIGWATGGLFFGMIGDRLGRVRTLQLTILMYAVLSGLSGVAQDVYQFSALRFLMGLGVGGEFAAGASLVAETFPIHARATALAGVQAASALGNMTAAVVNGAFFSQGLSWRWLFAVGVGPAIILVIILRFVHEPEVWVQARAVAKKGAGGLGSIFALFREPLLRRHTFIGVSLAAVGVIGFWGVGVLTPELLRSVLNPQDVPDLKSFAEKWVSIAGFSQNFGCFCGAMCFGYVAQRLGRRTGFLLAFAACLIMVPAVFFLTSSHWAAVVLFFLLGFALLAVLSGFAVYFPELFPTRMRSTGTGFCYNVARYITAAMLFATIPIKANLGMAGMVYAVMAVYVVGCLIIIFAAPETKGKPLPE
jgi:MFS family permease